MDEKRLQWPFLYFSQILILFLGEMLALCKRCSPKSKQPKNHGTDCIHRWQNHQLLVVNWLTSVECGLTVSYAQAWHPKCSKLVRVSAYTVTCWAVSVIWLGKPYSHAMTWITCLQFSYLFLKSWKYWEFFWRKSVENSHQMQNILNSFEFSP